jgi:hypothetical protein
VPPGLEHGTWSRRRRWPRRRRRPQRARRPYCSPGGAVRSWRRRSRHGPRCRSGVRLPPGIH